MRLRTETMQLLEDDGLMEGGLFERVLDRMVGGGEAVVGEVSSAYAVVSAMGLSWGGFIAWVTTEPGRMARFEATMRARAMLFGEQAIEIVDGAALEKNALVKAAHRARNRWRYAESWHPERFGGRAKVDTGGVPTLTITILTSPAVPVETGGALIEHAPQSEPPRAPVLALAARKLPEL